MLAAPLHYREGDSVPFPPLCPVLLSWGFLFQTCPPMSLTHWPSPAHSTPNTSFTHSHRHTHTHTLTLAVSPFLNPNAPLYGCALVFPLCPDHLSCPSHPHGSRYLLFLDTSFILSYPLVPLKPGPPSTAFSPVLNLAALLLAVPSPICHFSVVLVVSLFDQRS